jgi:hypothetical protein
VQKECQRLIHLIVHDKVFEGEPLRDEQKKEKMFSLVHGSDDPLSDQMSLNSLFLSGKQVFEAAFDWETISVTDQDVTTNQRLVLKEMLHHQSNKKYIVGEEITLRLISSSTLRGNNKVDGHKIKSNSETAKKNVLKCIAHAKIWFNRQETSPSGHNWDDMYHYVYNEMKKYFVSMANKGKDEEAHEIEDQDDDDDCTGQLQNGLFPGWMAFVLFAPIGPEPHPEIKWLQESPDSDNCPGCKDARKAKAEREKEVHSKHIGLNVTCWRGHE